MVENRYLIDVLIARAEADDNVRVMVISGAGERAFCAGADVKGFNAVDSLVKFRQTRAHAHWIGAFDRARKPIVAAIHGSTMPHGTYAPVSWMSCPRTPMILALASTAISISQY